MKNILFIALILASCASPITNINKATSTRHVMNSLWQEVTPEAINAVGKSISNRSAAINLDANVAAYNAAHIDDQWFIVDGDIPGIDEAPLAQIYIVDKVTHEPMIDDSGNPFSYTNWPRRQLVENYIAWMQYAVQCGGDIYIDVIPPPPTPPTAEQVYAAHQIYVINNVGAIKYHYDCSVVPAEGWPNFTPDTYFSYMLSTSNLIVRVDGVGQPDSPWSVVSGQLYTAP